MSKSYSEVFLGEYIDRRNPPVCCQRMRRIESPAGPRYVCLTCENLIKVTGQGLVVGKP